MSNLDSDIERILDELQASLNVKISSASKWYITRALGGELV